MLDVSEALLGCWKNLNGLRRMQRGFGLEKQEVEGTIGLH